MEKCTLKEHKPGIGKFPLYATALVITLAALLCVLNIGSDMSSADPGPGDSTSGECGTNLTWSYDGSIANGGTNTLTILGTGEKMDDFDDTNPADWSSYVADYAIIDMSGATNMTNIGREAFIRMTISKITFSPAITTIGESAFLYDGSDPENQKCYTFKTLNGKEDVTNPQIMQGRTFQQKKESNAYTGVFWLTGAKDGDYLCDDTYQYTVTEESGSKYLTLTGYKTGVTGTSTLTPKLNIGVWENTSGNGYKSLLISAIGDNAFAGKTNIEKVELTVNIHKIGASAFKNCTNLTDLTVNINVDLSTGRPFVGCTNISTIKFNAGTGETLGKGVDYAYQEIRYTPMFLSRTTLNSVTFDSSITSIGDYTLHGCTLLTSITLPNNLNRIGTSAFSNTGITSLETPSTLTTIGDYAFTNCESLITANLKGTNLSIGGHAFYQCIKLNNITLNEGVKYLGGFSFAYTKATVLKLPDSVITVSDGVAAFSSVERFEINDTNTKFKVDEKGVLYTINGATLRGVPAKLSGSYTVLEGTTVMPGNAFRGAAVEEVILPNGITSIGMYTFMDCTNLKKVYAPGVKTISDNAFQNSDLDVLIYSPNINSVSASAFNSSSSEKIKFYIDDTEIACNSDEFKTVSVWVVGSEARKMYAHFACEGISYQFTNDGASVTAKALKADDATAVVIPDTAAFNGTSYKVTNIDGLLADGQTTITSLQIGVNVNLPAGTVFAGMTNLGKIVMAGETPGSSVTFDKAVAANLAGGALSIKAADTGAYSAELRSQLGDRPVYSVTFGTNTSFGDGKIDITLSYTLKDGEEADKVYVAYLNGDNLERMEGAYENGKITFATDHLSDFAVMYDAPAGSGSGGENDNTMIYVAIAIVAIVIVAFLAMYFLHLGPFSKKD